MSNTEFFEHDAGFSWIADTTETLQRTSHALTIDDAVWLVDPVDTPGLRDRLAAVPVAGVVLLLDRHKRDSAAVARRHDVPVSLPPALADVATDLDVETQTLASELTPYHAEPLISNPAWTEVFLTDGTTLVVPEAVGTAGHFRTADVALGVHPMLRAIPPTSLDSLQPDRILVGHGPPVTENATAALSAALSGARRRAPRLYGSLVRDFLAGR